MKQQFSLLYGLVFTLALTACQTDMLKQYNSITVGMDKDAVLEIMGSPRAAMRWHGKDRWTYHIYKNHTRFDKEVQFSDGIADYVGDTWKPEISADQQDLMNETSNRELVAAEEAKRAQFKADQFQFLNPDNSEDKRIRYVPEFIPVQ
jgi:outer membrane protein assembly factor BamE